MTLQEFYESLPTLRNTRLDRPVAGSHSLVIPYATYSPWNDDQAFLDVYEVISKSTLVDIYRCYELWTLVAQASSLAGDILEVGVWRGGTGCLMAFRAQMLAAPSRVFLCDTFTGVTKAGEMDSFYQGGEHADTSMEFVNSLSEQLGVNNVEILKGIFPEETSDIVDKCRFSLCHIDVDVHDSARDITNWVWPRLNVGGCIVYDDYGFSTCDGVTRFVDESAPRAGAITLHNLNGHAVVVKTSP